jgi:malonate transporter
MLAIAITIAPVFALMALGGIIQRSGLLPPPTGSTLNAFVYRIALPALLFSSLAEASLGRVFQPEFVGGIVLGTLIPFALAAWLASLRHSGTRPLFVAFTATFSNAAFVGLPVLQLLFPGNPETVLAMGVFALLGLPFVLVAVFALERQRNPTAPLGPVLRTVGRNPLLAGSLAGATVSILHLPLPGWLRTVLHMVGHTASPLALVAIGMTLAQNLPAVRRVDGTALLLQASKLALHPAATFFLLSAWDVDPSWKAMGTMLAAMPVGTMAFVLAETYGILVAPICTAVALSTLLSPITLPLLFAIITR